MFAAIVNMRTTMVCARFAMTAGGVFPLNALGWAILGASENAAETFCMVLCSSVELPRCGTRLERFTTQFTSGKKPSALDKIVHDNECTKQIHPILAVLQGGGTWR